MGLLENIRRRYNRIQEWIGIHYEGYVLTILCLYGFFLNFRPTQFFVIEYINATQGVNISLAETLGTITPTRTYSALLILIPTILLTDMVRYKPALITQGVAYFLAYVFLLAAKSPGTLKFVEFLFGMGWALGVAHLTYGFAALQFGQFQKIAGYIRGYILMARALSAVLGQVAVSLNHQQDVAIINGIALFCVIVAVLLVFLLPGIPKQKFVVTSSGITPIRSVSTFNSGNISNTENSRNRTSESVTDDQLEGHQSQPYQQQELRDFNQSENANLASNENHDNQRSGFSEIQDIENETTEANFNDDAAVLQLNTSDLDQSSGIHEQHFNLNHSHKGICCRCVYANFYPLWQDFSRSYENGYIFKWSIWWAVMTAVYIQSSWYLPQLWKEISENTTDKTHIVRKGSVEAVSYFIASIFTFFCAYWKWNWRVLSDMLLTVTSLVLGLLWVIMSQVSSLWFSFICYGLLVISYQFILTVASIEIASHLTTGRFALVFGFNNFVAGTIHLLLMIGFVVLNSEDPDFSSQMLLNGMFIAITGVGFFIYVAFEMKREGVRNYLNNLKQQRYQEVTNMHM